MRDPASFLREAFRAFGEGDREAVTDLLDPEVAWYPALGPLLDQQVYRGQEDVCRLIFDEIPSVIDDFSAEILEIEHVDDETVLAMVRFSGRVASADLPIEQTFAQVHRMRDGRAFEMRSYSTRTEAIAALGGAR